MIRNVFDFRLLNGNEDLFYLLILVVIAIIILTIILVRNEIK